jgi:DNA helicase-2/ATP-dependent DNA helicase PcrA
MCAANSVIRHLERLPRQTHTAIPYAKPVIRHGPPVSVQEAPSLASCARQIDKKITAYQNSGYRSIAVICKTLQECHEIKKLLTTEPTLITGQESAYEGGLLLIPAYLVKGLEFDAVIIANAGEGAYRMEDLDIKLLYIAMTRALHELAVFSIGKRSGLINENDFRRAACATTSAAH